MIIFSLSLPERLELQVDTVTQAADAAAARHTAPGLQQCPLVRVTPSQPGSLAGGSPAAVGLDSEFRPKAPGLAGRLARLGFPSSRRNLASSSHAVAGNLTHDAGRLLPGNLNYSLHW